MDQDELTTQRSSSIEATHARDGSLWAIVLAGGEGVRLRPLVRQICGDERPKQYVPLLGALSLLQQTIDRLPRMIPPERTVVVTMRSHRQWLDHVLRDYARPVRMLAQPQDRGTAAAILLGAHWVLARDPHATAIVLPSDHLIVEEVSFVDHLTAVARFVQDHGEWMVLLGVDPTEPETEYGWIEMGSRVGWTESGPLHRVLQFWEKPTPEVASKLLILVAGVHTLVAAGRHCAPELDDRLSRLSAFVDTEYESWALSQAYALAPRASFSHSVLQLSPQALAVSKLSAVTWCDLGSPDRVMKTLKRLRISPPWLAALPHPG